MFSSYFIDVLNALLVFLEYYEFLGPLVIDPVELPFILNCSRYSCLSLRESRFSLDFVQKRRSEKHLTLNLVKLI